MKSSQHRYWTWRFTIGIAVLQEMITHASFLCTIPKSIWVEINSWPNCIHANNSIPQAFNDVSHYMCFSKEISLLKCSFSLLWFFKYKWASPWKPSGQSYPFSNCLASLNRSTIRVVESGPDAGRLWETGLGDCIWGFLSGSLQTVWTCFESLSLHSAVQEHNTFETTKIQPSYHVPGILSNMWLHSFI